MQIIDSLIRRSKLFKGVEQTVKALTSRQSQYIGNQFNIAAIWGKYDNLTVFQTVDDIYSVVKFVAETEARIPLYGYQVKEDKALKKYKTKSQATIQGQYFRTKALEDLPETDKLAQFLSQMDYNMRYHYGVTMRICGEYFAWQYVEDIGPNKGRITWYPLNPNCMQVIITDTFPYQVVKYWYNDGTKSGYFEPSEIIHVMMPNPDYHGKQFRGLSPIVALTKRITRLDANMSASTGQLQNGGIPGVIYDKGTVDVTALGKMKNDFASYLENRGNVGAPYWGIGELGYIPFGSTLADLEAADLADIDFKKICNAFSVPVQLMNNTESSTDNNMEASEKRLYTNSIIPNIIRLRDAITKKVLPLIPGKRFIDYDISDIPVLQDDMQNQATALASMWWVTPNEKREIMKFDVSENVTMDKFIIPSGMMLLNDLIMNEDVDTAGEYGQDS